MKPYTKIDRLLVLTGPIALGMLAPLVVSSLFGRAPHNAGLLIMAPLLLMCARSYLRGLRRYDEIKKAARERGRRKAPGLLLFTDAEVDEVRLIMGQRMANAIRRSRVEHW
jgi:hypothetical protein